jgi:hypothetical protein
MKRYGYYGKGWYLYLALLIRTEGSPKRVYKIGITNARDPMLRLTYNSADEPYPIINYFPEIFLLKYLWFPTEQQAKRAERFIMWSVKQKFNTPRFHNWKEKDCISGITEMRIWNDNEIKFVEQQFIICEKRYL